MFSLLVSSFLPVLPGVDGYVTGSDWNKSRTHHGKDWEGLKNRWNIASANIDSLVRSAGRVFEDWYDHPYAMWVTREEAGGEDGDENANGVRYYAGGKQGLFMPYFRMALTVL